MFLWMLPMTPRISVTLISCFRLACVLFHCRHDLIAVSLHGRFQFLQFLFPILGGSGFHFPLMSLLDREHPFYLCKHALGYLPGRSGHSNSSVLMSDDSPAQ